MKTNHWQTRKRLGRLQFGYHVYQHIYEISSDRWVFQPFLTFDRKKK